MLDFDVLQENKVDKILSDKVNNNIKYEICIGIKPHIPKSFFVKKWIYFQAGKEIKEKIEHYDKFQENGNVVIECKQLKNIEYGGVLSSIFKIFTRKLNKLEIELRRVTDILYVKEIEDKIKK